VATILVRLITFGVTAVPVSGQNVS